MKEQENKARTTSKAQPLLSEFAASTYEQWRTVAEKSLKGAPFEKKLLTKTYEGIELSPIYNEADARDLPHLGGLPGFEPYARGAQPLRDSANPWEICQQSVYPTPQEVNRALVRDLERGQTSLNLALDKTGRCGADPDAAGEDKVGLSGVSIVDAGDLEEIFKGISSVERAVYLQVGVAGIAVTGMLANHVQSTGESLKRLAGCVENDPLGELAIEGHLPRPLKALYDEMAALTRWVLKNEMDLRTVAVSANPYHDAGASAVEELGFALATGVEYIRQLQSRGLSVDEIAPKILFKFSVGPNFFMELAKLRAARLVWANAMEAFGAKTEGAKMFMHARTSRYSASALDPYVNMLRGTTEAFSAVAAGADCVCTSPFDEAVRLPQEFSRRIARNVQVILRDESHLGHVTDPAGGSWYVERLTHEIASRAWALFQQIEETGGMAKALEAGLPQEMAARTADARARDLASRKATIIGTNIYPNLLEKPLPKSRVDLRSAASERAERVSKLKADNERNGRVAKAAERLSKLAESGSEELVEAAVQAAADGATLGEIMGAITKQDGATEKVEPLKIHRAAERYERLRSATEAHCARTSKRPRVFLANLGPIPQHKARADFSTGFFEVGGFEVLGNDGFKTPDEAAKAAAESGAEVVVICSTDDTYPEIVPAFTASLKKTGSKAKIVLAGYPKDQIDAHKGAGVDEFIHMKANNYGILVELLGEIGVAL